MLNDLKMVKNEIKQGLDRYLEKDVGGQERINNSSIREMLSMTYAKLVTSQDSLVAIERSLKQDHQSDNTESSIDRLQRDNNKLRSMIEINRSLADSKLRNVLLLNPLSTEALRQLNTKGVDRGLEIATDALEILKKEFSLIPVSSSSANLKQIDTKIGSVMDNINSSMDRINRSYDLS